MEHKCDVLSNAEHTTGYIYPQSVRLSPDILEKIALLLMFGLKFRRLLGVDVFQGDRGLHLREKKFACHQTPYSSMLKATRKSKTLLLYLPFEEADSFCIIQSFRNRTSTLHSHTAAVRHSLGNTALLFTSLHIQGIPCHGT